MSRVKAAQRLAQRAVDAVTKPRASRAENEAAGLYHPIGDGLKLDRPLSEMTAVQEPIKDLQPHRFFSPEQLQGGRLIPLIGDRTAAGRQLTSINDRPLANPVMLEGGPDFMRTHAAEQAAWASGKSPIGRLARVTREQAANGDDVYGVYSAMGHTGGDFSTMMSDALLAQLPASRILKKDVKALDKEIRALRPEWPGLLDERAPAALAESGPLRLALVNRIAQDKYRQAGFPDVPSTRAAILEPDLLDAPLWSSGFSVARMDPTGRVIPNPRTPHKTYDTQLGGEYIGGIEQPIPRDVMFPDFFKERRTRGAPASGDNYAYQRADVVQKADQQWLDGVMSYIEQAKRRIGLLD